MVTGSKVFRYLRIVHSIPTVQDGEYVVFARVLGESDPDDTCRGGPLMPAKGPRYAVRSFPTQEIFIMRKDEPDSLKRITWDIYGDFLPLFVDNNEIMWIRWNHCLFPNPLWVYHFDIDTKKVSLVKKLDHNYGDAYKGIKSEIERNGYRNYLHLIR